MSYFFWNKSGKSGGIGSVGSKTSPSNHLLTWKPWRDYVPNGEHETQIASTLYLHESFNTALSYQLISIAQWNIHVSSSTYSQYIVNVCSVCVARLHSKSVPLFSPWGCFMGSGVHHGRTRHSIQSSSLPITVSSGSNQNNVVLKLRRYG